MKVTVEISPVILCQLEFWQQIMQAEFDKYAQEQAEYYGGEPEQFEITLEHVINRLADDAVHAPGHRTYLSEFKDFNKSLEDIVSARITQLQARPAPDNKTVTHKIQYQDIKKTMEGISLLRS